MLNRVILGRVGVGVTRCLTSPASPQFREFVPHHAGFKGRPATPPSQVILNPTTNYDYDTVLGEHFTEMFEFYIKTRRVDNAARLVRNVLITGLLENTEAISTIRTRFYEILHDDNLKVDILKNADIILFFAEHGGVVYQSMSRLIVSESFANPDVLYSVHDALQSSPYLARSLSMFYGLVVDRSIDQDDWRYLEAGLVDWSALSRDRVKRLIHYALRDQKYELALEVVTTYSHKTPNIVYSFYKTLRKTPGNDHDFTSVFEHWMQDNGFHFKDNVLSDTIV